MRRTVVSIGLVVAVELVLSVRYAVAGAQFHFWLHGLFGFALGLSVLTVARLLRPRLRLRSSESGLLGQMHSAVPDVLFATFGLLHVLWESPRVPPTARSRARLPAGQHRPPRALSGPGAATMGCSSPVGLLLRATREKEHLQWT